MRSGSVWDSGNGSYPRNRTRPGTAEIGGSVRPFSQLMMVYCPTPMRFPTSFWPMPSSSLRRRMWSPRVRGSKSNAFFLKDLSVTAWYGKKATRPCPCGYLGDASGRCRCSPEQVARYRARISGPLLDRIDLKVEAPAPRDAEMIVPAAAEGSASIRARVVAARERQVARQGKPNALLGVREIERHCALDSKAAKLLRQAIARLSLSARAYHRVLRVARSVADLAGAGTIAGEHVAEAIQYRRLDLSLTRPL